LTGDSAEFAEVAVVSCDILGHSAANGADQVRRVAAINGIVAETIHRHAPGRIAWSSGGDGGHVIFLDPDWQADAVELVARLWEWARTERIKLRVTGHAGEVATVPGADERIQAVGPAINFAGWLIRQANGHGVVVSDKFRRGLAAAAATPDLRFHDERLEVDRTSTPQLLYLMSFDRVDSKWPAPEQDDYASLKNSLKAGNGWEALYYAKRISQINAKDPGVSSDLAKVSRILKSSADENHSFLELLRPDELTEMLKLGHLVERTPGEVICRVHDPGESLFVILHGEVGVYNLEGKGFGGNAEPKHRHRAGEVVGELAPALKRTRTADLVAMTDVALLSFIGEEVREKLDSAGTPVGRNAADQWNTFLLNRVVQHTIQVAPYLLGPTRQGPLSLAAAHSSSRVSEQEAWEVTMGQLLPHTELITVDDGSLNLEIEQVTRKLTTADAKHGLFVLVSGSVRSSKPDAEVLSDAQCPLLWVDVPKLVVEPPSTYTRVAEPVMVLWVGATGIDQLSLEQRTELRRSLGDAVGEVPPEYEYDVYLCHSSEDKRLVLEIKDRLWREYSIRSWYDNAELGPGDSTRRKIEKGLRASRFFLICASVNLTSSEWANREIDAVLHLDVKRRHGEAKVLVLKLYEHESNDDAIPVVFRGTKRQHFQRLGDFERLAEYIVDAVRRNPEGASQ
jgi:class 3 adenylate cyclase